MALLPIDTTKLEKAILDMLAGEEILFDEDDEDAQGEFEIHLRNPKLNANSIKMIVRSLQFRIAAERETISHYNRPVITIDERIVKITMKVTRIPEKEEE